MGLRLGLARAVSRTTLPPVGRRTRRRGVGSVQAIKGRFVKKIRSQASKIKEKSDLVFRMNSLFSTHQAYLLQAGLELRRYTEQILTTSSP